jgi:hypothetical protein
LAREKSEADIRSRQIAEEIAVLPIGRQRVVIDLAQQLTDISLHLASAAKYGAATAHRLAGIANAQAVMIDDADPLAPESLVALKGIAALTKMSNDASEIGINLLRANKDTVDDLNKRAQEAARVENYTDEQLDDYIAQRAHLVDRTAPRES